MIEEEIFSQWEINDDDVISFCQSSIISPEEVIYRIERIAEYVIDQIKSIPPPDDVEIRLNVRSSPSNSQVDPILGVFVQYDTPSKKIYSLVKNPHQFAVFFRVLSIVHGSLKRGEIITKRSIFYQDTSLFGNQNIVNTTIEDIACCLEIPRTSLNVVACQKGLVAGPLQWQSSNGVVTDCSNNVEMIPSLVDSIVAQKTRAVAILVIEKETVFQRLVQSSIVNEAILVTAKGIPDYSTRLFLKLLEDSFEIPIVGLFDADPYGAFIFFIYRFGSRSSAYDGMNMTVSSMKWLGIRPKEFIRLGLSNANQNFDMNSNLNLSLNLGGKCMELTKNDHKLLDKMIEERNIPDIYRDELVVMKERNKKCEIEVLLDSNHTLTDLYLPQKFAEQDWI
ncbi:Meiotic recombination protein SPO11 [Tritrichomonas foetus]|uniref:DNA topoisomerase (ATP-hydrolyzing) n=1 Tax=Tritrichomonas foetus TaxID=1144522 RepID=A0A1J4L5U3_9EUKA|nr:Meiotic recombination protein SPO11 [Tritrichomonas foetus]|eukprot:OHT17380.1 Meiotic recombination protein SPO11 [Tritrichomonas foetus]